MEEWRPVVGFEGWYEVSDLGRVRRIRSASGAQVGRIIRPWVVGNFGGYLALKLSTHQEVTTHLVHVLVARAFLGDPPTLHHEVNHKDGIRTNPRSDNLEYLTRSENLKDGYRRGGSWGSQHIPQPNCIHGHPFTFENTRLTKAGHRRCRICDRDWMRQKRAKKGVLPI